MRRVAVLTLLLALAFPAASGAATRWVVRGGGFGHGIGMSQYGAYGYAQHGSDYREILAHYYTDTTIGSAAGRQVRVLLQASDPYVRFRGATRAGTVELEPGTMYRVTASGNRLAVSNGRKVVGRFSGKVKVSRPGHALRLMGGAINGISSGLYRGALVLSPSGGGVTAVNQIGVDPYIQGVVPGEMPSSWHMEALKVQAVAARTYALATLKRGGSFDLYPDTRSQVYKGVAGETGRTNSAVRATKGDIVEYDGEPAITYYFSTSGGHTENIENSFLGAESKPWLKGVEDPYDDISPRHRWRFNYSTSRLDSALGAPGTLQKVRVIKRGVSPRVVRARVYGSSGTTTITGPEIRARLGLYDSWVYFTKVSSSGARAARASLLRPVFGPRTLSGVFDPAPRGRRVAVERRGGKRWHRVKLARVGRHNRYRVALRRAGVYRVRSGVVVGPPVRIG